MRWLWRVFVCVVLLGVLTGPPARPAAVGPSPPARPRSAVGEPAAGEQVPEGSDLTVTPPGPDDKETAAPVDGLGVLTITAGGDPVNLGPWIPDVPGARRASAGPATLAPLTITDTRVGQTGYDVTGLVTDVDSGRGRIVEAALGWTPSVVSAPDVVDIRPGPTSELGVPRLLAAAHYDPATGAGSVGTAVVTAVLRLAAPAPPASDAYTATLVVTVV